MLGLGSSVGFRFTQVTQIETTTMGYIGSMVYILGLYRDNGKEHGNY